jgi:hypothetical protein
MVTMKTLFTIVLILIVFSPLHAQWYMAAEDGVCLKKIKYQEQEIYNNSELNGINTATAKSTTFHNAMFSIGAKLGYEFNPFIIELDGKLNMDMRAMAGIYSGAILSLNEENTLRLTPLIGISLDHNFSAAARLQYKHFFLEANKTGNATFCVIGIKCYVYE